LVDRYISLLEEEGKEGGREGGREGGFVVDVHNDMRFLTLEAVSQASFSLPLGLLGRDRGESLEYR
jgi:hypothetical protein